jgi:hypothetical protein
MPLCLPYIIIATKERGVDVLRRILVVEGHGRLTPFYNISLSRASVLVLLPHLLSASYLSCIIDTSCKQTLLLAFLEARTSRTTEQHNTQYFVFIVCSTLQQPTLVPCASPQRPPPRVENTKTATTSNAS